MPESGSEEELTLAAWLDAVKDAGWRVGFVAVGDGIVPRLFQATNKKQDHLPSRLSNQLRRFKVTMLDDTFGEKAEDGFRCCPLCHGCYLSAVWKDVRATCETSGCPLKQVQDDRK